MIGKKGWTKKMDILRREKDKGLNCRCQEKRDADCLSQLKRKRREKRSRHRANRAIAREREIIGGRFPKKGIVPLGEPELTEKKKKE